jgi:hypothetical protein
VQKTAEQIALADLVTFLVDHEPHFGYDASNLIITNDQAAIVIAGDPDAANDVVDAVETDAVLRLLRAWPGEHARNIASEMASQAVVLAREGATRALLQLVTAESERRDEERRARTPLDIEPDKYAEGVRL